MFCIDLPSMLQLVIWFMYNIQYSLNALLKSKPFKTKQHNKKNMYIIYYDTISFISHMHNVQDHRCCWCLFKQQHILYNNPIEQHNCNACILNKIFLTHIVLIHMYNTCIYCTYHITWILFICKSILLLYDVGNKFDAMHMCHFGMLQ